MLSDHPWASVGFFIVSPFNTLWIKSPLRIIFVQGPRQTGTCVAINFRGGGFVFLAAAAVASIKALLSGSSTSRVSYPACSHRLPPVSENWFGCLCPPRIPSGSHGFRAERTRPIQYDLQRRETASDLLLVGSTLSEYRMPWTLWLGCLFNSHSSTSFILGMTRLGLMHRTMKQFRLQIYIALFLAFSLYASFDGHGSFNSRKSLRIFYYDLHKYYIFKTKQMGQKQYFIQSLKCVLDELYNYISWIF